MGYQLVFRSPAGEQTVALDRPLVVGRDPSADVQLDSVRVSRRHAEFSPTPQGVLVRDLGSRNGIMINGQRADQATIGPTDRVLLGDVAVTVSTGAGVPATSRPAQPPVYAPPPIPAAPPYAPPEAPPAYASPPPYAAPESVPPPFAPPPPYAPPAPPPYAPQTYAPPQSYGAPPPSQPPAAWGSPAGAGAADKTTMLPRRPGAGPGGLPAPGAGPLPPAQPGVPAAPAQTSLVSKLGNRLGFGGRMIAGTLAAAFLTFLITAIPFVQARTEVVEREAAARATTIARAVGLENGVALASGQTLSVSVQSALQESGVREALVLTPQGRVLAPTERLDETMNQLGAFGDISALQGLQTAVVGSEVQAAAVIESGGRRLGVIWVRLDPNYAHSGSPVALYLLATLVTSLVVASAVGFLLKKSVMARLAAFATDIDLAASGQQEVVTESFGLPRLAESVNFVIGRLRLAPQQVVQIAPPPPPPPPPADPAQAREGRLVLDASFVVKEASAGAAFLLKTTTERLESHHVLEAIGEQAMVNAIIDAIGDLAGQGSAMRRVEGAGLDGPLELHARRSGPDGPIEVTIRRTG